MKSFALFRCGVTLLGLVVIAGCAPAPTDGLTTYPAMDDSAALQTLCDRTALVHSMSAACDLTLTRPDSESVELDGAIVLAPPDSIRLRAFKMGQAVFDLTLTPAGLWIESPKDPDESEGPIAAHLGAASTAKAFSVLFGRFFCGSNLSVQDDGRPRFIVERTIDNQRIVCEVDRATLTPRKYRVIDPDGVQRFVLTLDRYKMINGIPWPVHLTGQSDSGQFAVELKDVELNGELPPTAFVPPRKATRMPQ